MTAEAFQDAFGSFTTISDLPAPDLPEVNVHVLEVLLRKDLGCVMAMFDSVASSTEHTSTRPSMTLASQFIIPSSEISLYFYVYKVLESFARFGDAKERISVEFVNSGSGSGPIIPVDKLEVVHTSEEKIKGMYAQGTANAFEWSRHLPLRPYNRQAQLSSSSTTQSCAEPSYWWR